jgi:hypothetical protein
MREFSLDHVSPPGLEIVNKYPTIYLEPCPYIKEAIGDERFNQLIESGKYCNLRFGFEFEDGWLKLVDEFSSVVAAMVADIKRIYPFSDYFVHGFVFKQKFGELTWQGSANLPEHFMALFRAYSIQTELKSRHICEISGEYGSIRQRSGGWIRCLSDQNAEKLGYPPNHQRKLIK